MHTYLHASVRRPKSPEATLRARSRLGMRLIPRHWIQQPAVQLFPENRPAGHNLRRHWLYSLIEYLGLENCLPRRQSLLEKQRKRMLGLSIAGSSISLFCLIDYVLAGLSPWQISISSSMLASGGQAALDIFRHYLPKTAHGTLSLWEMVQITALCGAIPGVLYLQRQFRRKDSFTPSWKSTSKLNRGVTVNEEELGGKLLPTTRITACSH